MPIDAFRIYRGEGSPAVSPPLEPRTLPRLQRDKLTDPAGYHADPGLVDAVNVALHLGKPLLLTGEAGTGKTILAVSLAWELGYALEVYETKSSSTATDLFYSYNALAQFNVAQLEGRRASSGGAPGDVAEPPERLGLRYVRYNALGSAILRGSPREKVAHLLPPGFEHPGAPTRSVVLLDEIDKSPRDLPNDVLSALDSMAFSIPELGNVRVKADPDFRPVLVLSSNSEKALPDPFLRRCIFYHIPFPEGDDLKRIVRARLGAMSEKGSLLADALDLFGTLRKAPGLRKRPATAELLDWLVTLQTVGTDADANPLRGSVEDILPTLTCLVKTVEDRPLAAQEVARWRGTRP
jgi:MoxR-like ATPase